MILDSAITIVITLCSVIIAPLLYIWRSLVKRLEKLEDKVEDKMDEDDVRLLLEDKLVPINKNIEEIKELLYKLLLKLGTEK